MILTKSGKMRFHFCIVFGALTASILFLSCSKDKPTEPATRVPSVTTAAITGITQTTAACGGTITSDGGATVTARGVCWSRILPPTVADDTTFDGTGTGEFISSVISLTTHTKYYVRAYATNTAGTGYGLSSEFTTFDTSGPVTDIDGNIYPTVRIGTQWWMARNLEVTHYRNGDSIPNVTDGTTWASLNSGAYCNYNNDTSSVAVYGRLYNWHALGDSRQIAPDGWHVPTDAEWRQLEMNLGMSQAQADSLGFRGTTEGGKLKEAGTSHWNSPNTGASDESGFSALPGGYCAGLNFGNFGNMGKYGYFWSSTEYYGVDAWGRSLNYLHPFIGRIAFSKGEGFSVRCIKDN